LPGDNDDNDDDDDDDQLLSSQNRLAKQAYNNDAHRHHQDNCVVSEVEFCKAFRSVKKCGRKIK